MILYAPKSEQTVELDIPEGIERVGCRVSGGADTAILFYILSKYIKDSKRDIKIFPIHKNMLTRPQIQDAINIVNKVKEILSRDGSDVSFIQDVICLHIPTKPSTRLVEYFNYRLFETGTIQICYGGTTHNPMDENFIFPKIGMRDHNPPRRHFFNVFFPDEKNLPEGMRAYHLEFPFGQVDKRFVAEMYDLYKVKDELLPLTWSCEGSWLDTKAFTEPCGNCYWCHEKEWAFGSMDSKKTNYVELLNDELSDYLVDQDWHYKYKENFKNKSWWWHFVTKYITKRHYEVNHK